MSSVQAMPGRGVGYVRAVFSKRGKGFAAPVDLLRVHMRAVVRSGERRRVAAAFAGYLVTDAGPEVVPMFSERRRCHGLGNDAVCMTGDCPSGLRREALPLIAWALDAPELMAAGSMHGICGEGCGVGRVVKRGGE